MSDCHDEEFTSLDDCINQSFSRLNICEQEIRKTYLSNILDMILTKKKENAIIFVVPI